MVVHVPGSTGGCDGLTAVEDLADRGESSVGVVAVGQVRDPEVAACPVEQGHQRGGVGGSDDEVAFEVADLATATRRLVGG